MLTDPSVLERAGCIVEADQQAEERLKKKVVAAKNKKKVVADEQEKKYYCKCLQVFSPFQLRFYCLTSPLEVL